MNRLDSQPTPELLYLLHGDPADLQEALVGLRAADIADALRSLAPDAAAKVMAALPFDLAVQVFDEPELEYHRFDIIKQMAEPSVAPLIEAMSADQQADLFRELPEKDRIRLLKLLDEPMRRTMAHLLEYAPDTGGIMTTEFVGPGDVDGGPVLRHIVEVSRAKAVYVAYVLDPAPHLIRRVVARTLSADRIPVIDVGDRRTPLSNRPAADREDVAHHRQYNLLALPVVDDNGHMLGIVTVDDVIDALVREQTEDAENRRRRGLTHRTWRSALRGCSKAPLAWHSSLGDAHRNGDATLSRQGSRLRFSRRSFRSS
jgi:magnesium transporter